MKKNMSVSSHLQAVNLSKESPVKQFNKEDSSYFGGEHSKVKKPVKLPGSDCSPPSSKQTAEISKLKVGTDTANCFIFKDYFHLGKAGC